VYDAGLGHGMAGVADEAIVDSARFHAPGGCALLQTRRKPPDFWPAASPTADEWGS